MFFGAIRMFWSVAVPFAATWIAEDLPIDTFDLGGPRRVSAQVSKTSDGEVEVSIDMLAVQCFDKATNMQLSREKANQYVYLALAEYLGVTDKRTTRLKLAGMTTKSSLLDGNRYKLTVTLPNPRQVQTTALPSANSTTSAKSIELEILDLAMTQTSKGKKISARKANRPDASDDFIETSQFLLQAFKLEFPKLPSQTDDEGRAQFYRMIADIEEKAERDFDAIVREVKSSKLLLSVEIEKLVLQIFADRDELNKLLAQAADSLPPP